MPAPQEFRCIRTRQQNIETNYRKNNMAGGLIRMSLKFMIYVGPSFSLTIKRLRIYTCAY